MKGNVIGFDPETNTGAISGHDGNRYDFVTLDWRGPGRPRKGDLVDFQAIDQRATEIFLIEPQYVAPGFWIFYFSPSGRISRSQYWLRFYLPYFGIYFVLQIASVVTSPVAGDKSAAYAVFSTLSTIFSLVALWPAIAVLIKRIHDRNKSGWFCLFLYAPVTLFIALLAVWFAGMFIAIANGSEPTLPSLGPLGISTIVVGIVSMGVSLWFFVEFGCLRGTIGANRYGPDPTK